MAKVTRSAASSNRDTAVRAAIEYAEKYAGNDDEQFINALNLHFHGPAKKARGDRSVVLAEAPTKSFHIYNDPRYLANARELARRTLGGLRVLGGAPVKPGDLLDCVAVGSDNQWGCTGTLIATNAVLTAGHCVNFATRVFFGNDVTKPGKVVRVKKRVRHPQYHKGKHNDLMVLVLEEKVETVKPCKLAAKSLIDKASDGRVVGFGTVDSMGMFGYGIKRFLLMSPSRPLPVGAR